MTQHSLAKPKAGPELPGMFARYRTWVEEALSRSVPDISRSELYILVRYHLGWSDQQGIPAEAPVSQGKALRPTLCLFASQALAQDITHALPSAAALELIHNFSLIHDDIQDQDRERRHQPTVWHLWGLPKALVAGNAMQSSGDIALLNTGCQGPDTETILKVSELLTDSYLEMIQGQCLDLAFESRTDISTEEYLQMIAYKTGSLIRSGLEIGAILSTEDPVTLQAFSRFGNYLGRAFQIRDDFLGIWGDETITGKAAGNDIRRRKKSFPIVLAFSQADGEDLKDLRRIYRKKELDEEDVTKVLAILDKVDAQDHCRQITETSAADALTALKRISLPEWAQHEAEELVEFLSRREY